jgi:hypothetical protein
MSPLHMDWQEDGAERRALWQADNGARLPSRVQTVREVDADTAYRLASAGTGLLWRGDYQLARQLLQAMSARMEAAAARKKTPPQPPRSKALNSTARRRPCACECWASC